MRRRTSTAVAYSTAQQLIITAWNIVFALLLVVLVFGWTGGKLLVGQSYTDAKGKVAEQKTQRADKKAQKKAERTMSGEGRLHRRHAHEHTEDSSSAEEETKTSSEPRAGRWHRLLRDVASFTRLMRRVPRRQLQVEC